MQCNIFAAGSPARRRMVTRINKDGEATTAVHSTVPYRRIYRLMKKGRRFDYLDFVVHETANSIPSVL